VSAIYIYIYVYVGACIDVSSGFLATTILITCVFQRGERERQRDREREREHCEKGDKIIHINESQNAFVGWVGYGLDGNCSVLDCVVA